MSESIMHSQRREARQNLFQMVQPAYAGPSGQANPFPEVTEPPQHPAKVCEMDTSTHPRNKHKDMLALDVGKHNRLGVRFSASRLVA